MQKGNTNAGSMLKGSQATKATQMPKRISVTTERVSKTTRAYFTISISKIVWTRKSDVIDTIGLELYCDGFVCNRFRSFFFFFQKRKTTKSLTGSASTSKTLRICGKSTELAILENSSGSLKPLICVKRHETNNNNNKTKQRTT